MSITKVNADVLDLTDAYAFTGDVSGAGKLKQVVYADSHAIVTGSTTVALDDTIFQNSEGVEIITLAITPTASNSILKIEFNCTFGGPSAVACQLGLFQDTTANALSSQYQYVYGYDQVSLLHLMTAGTTSATTFKVRGGGASGTVTFNGYSGSNAVGGDIPHTTLAITEIGA
jgi:hypothetical protein